MRLTIVLTIYNKEPFLQRAFDSLLSQVDTLEGEYEVLAVNDGSTDGSAGIIDSYSKRDNRVRVVTQQNQGLSMARNNGTDAALGEYVWFVDADDVFSPHSVRMICDAMNSKPDIIPIYAQTEGKEGVRNCVPISARTGKDILLSGKWQPCGVFNVFKREFLRENNLRFFPGIYHEDSEFTPRMLYAAKTVNVVPEVLYTVIHEPQSITQVPRAKRAFDYLVVANSLYQFMVEKGELETEIGRVFCNRICAAINNGFGIIVKNCKDDQLRYNESIQNNTHLIKAMKKSSIRRYALEAFLLDLFPRKSVSVYKVMRFIAK